MALTVAVFVILPASTSDCVIVYVAVPVAVPPGAMVLGVNARFVTPSFVSVIVGFVNVTLPVLVAVKVYVMISPAFKPAVEEAVFTSAIFPVCANGVIVGLSDVLLLLSDTSETLRLEGSFALTVAVFVILPAFISACVII